MNFRSSVILIVIFLALSGCSGDPGKFVISGTFSNAHEKHLYLYEMTTSGYLAADSAVRGPDGTFELSGNTGHSKFYTLQFSGDNSVILVASPGDRIELKADARDLPGTYTLSGSPESEQIRQLNRQLSHTIGQIRQLGTVLNENTQSPDFMRIKDSLDRGYAEIISAQKQYTHRFILANLNSLAGLMALYQQIGPRRYLLDPMEDFNLFTLVDSALSIHQPESEAARELHRQVTELQAQKSYLDQSREFLGEGREAPPIALPGPGGDTLALSSLRGKVVLLDFWASWCLPCREENPNLVRLYRKYHSQGFEIYQVSLDRSRTAWLKGIQDDSLDWVHVSDLKMWESVVVGIYGLQAIPMNFLLDREGRILGRNLRGPVLEEKLAGIFNK